MPFYHKLGQFPHKRHTQFKKPNGKLYREELMGLEGFSSIQSILYHNFLPPRVTKTEDSDPSCLNTRISARSATAPWLHFTRRPERIPFRHGFPCSATAT